jgi:glycosyltransferase involved in cell wall biosynthesis
MPSGNFSGGRVGEQVMWNRRLPSLTVVMPCLDEENNVTAAVQATLKAMDRRAIKGELIIVNDGSTDRTREILEALSAQDNRIRVFNHDRPNGIGASFLHGVREARGEFVTMFPGDNENDADDALTYFYLSLDVDIIVPFIHNVEVRSRWRRLLSSIYRFIVNMTFGTNLNYTNGTVIYNTEVLRDVIVNSKGFFYQAELLIKLVRAGYLYAEAPHFLATRPFGTTKALTLRSLGDVIRSYLGLIWDIHIVRRSGRAEPFLNEKSVTYQRMYAMKNREDSAK